MGATPGVLFFQIFHTHFCVSFLFFIIITDRETKSIQIVYGDICSYLHAAYFPTVASKGGDVCVNGLLSHWQADASLETGEGGDLVGLGRGGGDCGGREHRRSHLLFLFFLGCLLLLVTILVLYYTE